MKNFVFVIVLFAFVVIFSSIVCAEPPILVGCTCARWSNYEFDLANYRAGEMRRSVQFTSDVPDAEIENFNRAYSVWVTDAKVEKYIYIKGILDSYDVVYLNGRNEHYNFPYTLGQYIIELDVFAKDPKNADVSISEALLIVNKQMRDRNGIYANQKMEQIP